MGDGKKYRSSIQSLIAALALVVYTTGTIGVDLLHHSLHDHEDHVLHTAESEKDSCHRYIYHQDKNEGCTHDTHITKAEKCKYSHVVFQSCQLLFYPVTIESSFEDYFVPDFYRSCTLRTSLLKQSLRGPPAV